MPKHFDMDKASEKALSFLRSRFADEAGYEKSAYHALIEGWYAQFNELRYDRFIAELPLDQWGDKGAANWVALLMGSVAQFPAKIGRELGTYAQGLLLDFVLEQAIFKHGEFQFFGIRVAEKLEDWSLWVYAHRDHFPYHWEAVVHHAQNIKNLGMIFIKDPAERREFEMWIHRLFDELDIK